MAIHRSVTRGVAIAANRPPMRLRHAVPVALGLLAGVLSPDARAASADLVISQVYGGGGNSGATLRNDYVELLNRGSTPVSVAGWSVQYASAAGTTWQRTNLPAVTVPAGGHLLVQEAAGAGGTADLPAPDATGAIAMSATSGKVALVTATVALTCGATNDCANAATVRDLVGYGSAASSWEGAGRAPAPSNTTAVVRGRDGCTDTDDNGGDFATAAPAPRNAAAASTDCAAPPPPLVLTPIHDIQGSGHRSPLTGDAVTTTGVVTALRANGFHLQDAAADSDDATSEALFVFTGSAPTVAVGDAVQVAGRVAEFRPGGSSNANLTTTELTGPAVTVLSSGNPLPAAVLIGAGGRVPPTDTIEDDAAGSVETGGTFDPADDGIDFYESLEGMRIALRDATAVGPTRDFGSNREIPVLADGGAGAGLRTPRGGIVLRPGDANPERLILNDLVTGGPTLPALDTGDGFPGMTLGVLDYSFGNFKLEVTGLPSPLPGGLAPETTEPAGTGELALATFNVENLDPTDPPAKFARLAGLVVRALRSPDVISVEEVQDDDGPANTATVAADRTWSLLIDAITAAGGPRYDYRQIDPADGRDGGEPGGNIRQGFLFRTDRGLSFVDRAGGDATTATTVADGPDGPQLSLSPGRVAPGDAAFTASRKPLVGEFRYDGHPLFVVANHWNSKGGDQPLFGRFQPPARSSETQRRAQAQIVHDFTANLLAEDPDARVAVLGDLNDFDFSDALATLKGSPAILDDLIASLPEGERYSYVFEGNSQALDHVLTSTAATRELRGVDAVHVNAEFADQASDHDPVVARICADTTPPSVTVHATPDRLWPPNHKYVTLTVTATAQDGVDPSPAVALASVTSSEPDDAPGDANGSTRDDVDVNGSTIRVRAERDETGQGRRYTITYRATDACGNRGTGAATVTVPVGAR